MQLKRSGMDLAWPLSLTLVLNGVRGLRRELRLELSVSQKVILK